MQSKDVTPTESADLILPYVAIEFIDAMAIIPKQLSTESERTIRTLLKPDDTMYSLKSRFWHCIAVARATGVRFTFHESFIGICTLDYATSLLKNHRYLAWLLIPVMNYEDKVSGLLQKSLDKIADILDESLYDEKTGKLDKQLLGTILSTFKMLDMRKHGGYVQRIEEKSWQIHSKGEDVKKDVTKLSLEEIDKKIAELESQKTKDIILIEEPSGRSDKEA